MIATDVAFVCVLAIILELTIPGELVGDDADLTFLSCKLVLLLRFPYLLHRNLPLELEGVVTMEHFCVIVFNFGLLFV